MDSLVSHIKLFSWNVQGLNSMAWQEEVRQAISEVKPDLIYMQETKLSALNPALIRSLLGPNFENNFVYLRAAGTRGILIAAMESVSSLSN
jgi:exonuclease III